MLNFLVTECKNHFLCIFFRTIKFVINASGVLDLKKRKNEKIEAEVRMVYIEVVLILGFIIYEIYNSSKTKNCYEIYLLFN